MVKKQVSVNNKKNKVNVKTSSSNNLSKTNKSNNKLTSNKRITANKTLRINKDWSIDEIFNKFPSHIDRISEVMSDYGLHCAGCSANKSETLEQGIESHGFDEEMLNSLIDDLNKIINGEEHDDSNNLMISKSAISKLTDILTRKSKDLKKPVFLRVNYDSNRNNDGVCCKSLYSLGFEVNPKSVDEVIDVLGIKVVLKKADLDFFKGLAIDYVDNKDMKGFKITVSSNRGCDCSSH